MRWHEDFYEDLSKISERIYQQVSPARREVQLKLTPYTPKPFGEPRTYGQDWPVYERACSSEKLMFFRILNDAADHLMVEYEYKGNGRPPVFLADIVKALCIRIYSNYSSWRAESELRIARAFGVIDQVPRKSTLNKYLKSQKVTKLLHKLYKVIAEPLSEVEVYFAADATGISNAYGNKRWIEVRHTKGERKEARKFTKLHIITGVKTNVVCVAEITHGHAHESPYLPSMLSQAAKTFRIKEVSADAGYLSRSNVRAIAKIGAEPFIMGKKNVHVPRTGGGAWVEMLRRWRRSQEFFAEHYHRRSNVESTFGMLKRNGGITQEPNYQCLKRTRYYAK